MHSKFQKVCKVLVQVFPYVYKAYYCMHNSNVGVLFVEFVVDVYLSFNWV